MPLNLRHWLGLERITVANEPSGQMAKKDNPLRCIAIAPEKPDLRCNWHVNKHPSYHMAMSHEHNSKEAITWWWPRDAVDEKIYGAGICAAQYGGGTALICDKAKYHPGIEPRMIKQSRLGTNRRLDQMTLRDKWHNFRMRLLFKLPFESQFMRRLTDAILFPADIFNGVLWSFDADEPACCDCGIVIMKDDNE